MNLKKILFPFAFWALRTTGASKINSENQLANPALESLDKQSVTQIFQMLNVESLNLSDAQLVDQNEMDHLRKLDPKINEDDIIIVAYVLSMALICGCALGCTLPLLKLCWDSVGQERRDEERQAGNENNDVPQINYGNNP